MAQGAAQPYFRQFVSALPGSFRAHKILLLLMLAYWMCGIVIGEITDRPRTATITMYLPTYQTFVPFVVLLLLAGRAFIIVAYERPARPLSQFATEFRHALASPQRIAHALPVLLSLPIFGGTFTVVKTSLPLIMPFAWDAPLEKFDRWLHGGVAPWELLHPLIGIPLVTSSINLGYNLWFYVLGIILVWQTFSQRDARLRLQFFFTLVLAWILLGTIAAALLSSAGPCYFGRVTGMDDPFEPLIAYLREADQSYTVWAIHIQDSLWDTYLLRSLSLGAGISAMPSMHVALATLFALVCWRTNRWLGIAMTFYVALILIGSVHLAWHYAVDGYFSIVAMIAIWKIVGWWLVRDELRQRVALADAT